MTVKTPAELIIDLNNDLPDITSALISPADSRVNLINGVESWDSQKIDNSQDVVNRFNANKIQSRDVVVTVPTDKQLLVFNASSGKWEPKNSYKSVGYIGFVDNAVATTISTQDTPVIINPATFTSFLLTDFSQSTNGRLTYDGVDTKTFFINLNTTLFTDNNNDQLTSYIALNGSVIRLNLLDTWSQNASPDFVMASQPPDARLAIAVIGIPAL